MAIHSQEAVPKFISLGDYTDLVRQLGIYPAAVHEVRLLPGKAQILVSEARQDGSKNRRKKRRVTIPVR